MLSRRLELNIGMSFVVKVNEALVPGFPNTVVFQVLNILFYLRQV